MRHFPDLHSIALPLLAALVLSGCEDNETNQTTTETTIISDNLVPATVRSITFNKAAEWATDYDYAAWNLINNEPLAESTTTEYENGYAVTVPLTSVTAYNDPGAFILQIVAYDSTDVDFATTDQVYEIDLSAYTPVATE